jgi:hypothetical protein
LKVLAIKWWIFGDSLPQTRSSGQGFRTLQGQNGVYFKAKIWCSRGGPVYLNAKKKGVPGEKPGCAMPGFSISKAKKHVHLKAKIPCFEAKKSALQGKKSPQFKARKPRSKAKKGPYLKARNPRFKAKKPALQGKRSALQGKKVRAPRQESPRSKARKSALQGKC